LTRSHVGKATPLERAPNDPKFPLADPDRPEYLNAVWGHSYPRIESRYGALYGADPVPKPISTRVPLMVTGNSQQSVDWIASKTDGWITYLRPLDIQVQVIRKWHDIVDAVAPGTFKPFALPYKIDLVADPDVPPRLSTTATVWAAVR
jgi:hypothetical protein